MNEASRPATPASTGPPGAGLPKAGTPSAGAPGAGAPEIGPPEAGTPAAVALAALPSGVMVYDPLFRLAYANAAAWRLAGLEPAQMPLGSPLREVLRLLAYRGVYGAGDPEALAALAAQQFRLDRGRAFRRLLRGVDGTCFDLHSVPLPEGGFCIVVAEVTAQLAAAEEATLRARRLEAVLAQLQGGVAAFEADGRIALHNAAYEELIGLPRGAVRPGMTETEVLRALAGRGEFSNLDPEELIADRIVTDRSRPQAWQRERPNGRVLRLGSQPMPDGGFLVEVADVTAARRAENEARRRAALLDGVLAAMPHGVVVFGPDQRVAMVNAAYQAIMAGAAVAVGEHRHEIARRRAEAGEYGGDDAEAMAHEDLAEPGGCEAWQRQRPGGRMIDIRHAALPDGGRVQVTTDITALHQARAEATGRAHLLQLMLDNMRHGIALFNADKRLVTANPLAATLMGLPPERLRPGETLGALVTAQGAAGEFSHVTPEQLAEVLATEDRTRPMRYTRTRPDGTVVEIISDPTPDGGFVCTYSDITSRARAEADAREQAATLQATIDNLRHGIAVFGPDRRVRVANRLSSELAGHRPGAIQPGRSLEELVLGLIVEGGLEPGPETDAWAARVLSSDRSASTRSIRHARGGRVLEVHSDPMPDGGFVVTHIDITPLARAEAEARARAGMLQVMLDNMRHGIALFGRDRRIIAANALAVSISGIPAEAIAPGVSLERMVEVQLRAGTLGKDAEAAGRAAQIIGFDRSQPSRYQRVLPDGWIIDVSSDPTPDGGFVITWSDITARARAEEAARQRAQMLQSMLDNTRHGIALYGADRRVLVANALAADLGNLAPDDLRPGRDLEEVLRLQESRGAFDAAEAERLITQDRRQPHRLLRTLPDGRIVEIASDPMPDGGFVVTWSDITARARAEAEAQARAAVLQSTLDSVRHAIAMYGPDHRLVTANRLARPDYGLPPLEERVGQSFAELVEEQRALGIFGSDAEAARVAAEAIGLDRSKPIRFERRLPSGRVVAVASDPTPDGGFIITNSDVTELAEAKAAASERAAVLQVMLDNMRHGICYYGADRRVIAANALAAELGGQAPGSLVPGRSLDELIAEQVSLGAIGGDGAALAQAALRMDRSRPARYVRPGADGRIVEVTSDPTPDGGFVVTMADITPLATAEAEAQRRAGIQQAMLDNIRHGIALFDPGDRVVAVNPVFRQMLDLPEHVLTPGRPYSEFVETLRMRGEYGPGEAGERVAAAILSRNRREPIRTIRTRPNGEVLEVVSDPTPDGGWVLTYTDVTEDRRIRAELEQARETAEGANRAKSRFLATMSHELRTPLNAVIGFSEAIMADPDPVRGQDYVKSIHEAGRHLLALIDDILDVARAETTGFAVADGEVDPVALAEASVRVMRATAATARVSVEAVLPPSLPRIRADEVRLRQVLLNLLSNAVKFTPSGGAVRLEAVLEPGGDLVLRVTDSGIGMAPDDIPRAFEPFTQLDSALSRRFQGSGLGLYLSRALAEAQGATLTLDSLPGAGTTAVLRFPADRLLPPLAALPIAAETP